MPTIDTIAVEGTVLYHVVRTDRLPDITTFATPPEAVMQVGHIVHPRGHEIARHAHAPVERHITGTAEGGNRSISEIQNGMDLHARR